MNSQIEMITIPIDFDLRYYPDAVLAADLG